MSDLIELRTDLDRAIAAVRQLPWDSERALATIRRSDAAHASRALTAEQLESWANALESREDVAEEDAVVREFVFAAANPVLAGEQDWTAWQARLQM